MKAPYLQPPYLSQRTFPNTVFKHGSCMVDESPLPSVMRFWNLAVLPSASPKTSRAALHVHTRNAVLSIPAEHMQRASARKPCILHCSLTCYSASRLWYLPNVHEALCGNGGYAPAHAHELEPLLHLQDALSTLRA